VNSADLIIAGRVENVRQTGSGDITYSGRAYSRRDFEAEIQVGETIRGKVAGSRFIFSYSTPATDPWGSVGEGNLVAGTFRILFLRKTRDGAALSWEGDSSAAPFLKAALSLPEVNSDPELRTPSSQTF